MTRADWMTPHPDRLSPHHSRYEEILALHRAAVAAGDPGYLDPDTGLFVITAEVHRRRGFCCGSGCRHCPYEED